MILKSKTQKRFWHEKSSWAQVAAFGSKSLFFDLGTSNFAYMPFFGLASKFVLHRQGQKTNIKGSLLSNSKCIFALA